MTTKRVIFLHYHLYKNAGTSIDRIFASNPGGSHHFEASNPDDSLETSELIRFVQEHPGITQITSHGIKPPRPEIPGCYVIDIVFLRHPIDRFRSIYDYNRAETRDGPIERAAKSLSMGDFATWMAQETPHNFFSPQTTIMGNHGEFFHPPTSTDLERAMIGPRGTPAGHRGILSGKHGGSQPLPARHSAANEFSGRFGGCKYHAGARAIDRAAHRTC